MKTIVLLVSLFISIFSLSLTSSAQLKDRQSAHEWAADTFVNTHFFENGRGMTLSPDLAYFFNGLTSKDKSILPDAFIQKRYGFLPGVNGQRFVGVFEVDYKDMKLAVLGCTACHSGRAAGQFVPGLGNKTIDPHAIGKDILKAQTVWGHLIKKKIQTNPDYKYIHEKAMNFANVLANKDISNLTRGLVPDSVIKTFFYRDQGVSYGAEIERTQVKVPFLWGFSEKRKSGGVFADGSLSSDNYAWAFGAELMASDSGPHLRASLPKLKYIVDEVLSKLLPPKYPFTIDEVLANKGQALVEKRCFSCHGTHNKTAEGLPIYTAPQLVLQDFVQTDPQRLSYANSLWVDLAEQGSVGDLIKFNHNKFNYGYFAPKLWGIWSRFPYLHNGSVPTLYHMLVPQDKRPEVFSMTDAGERYRYDTRLGGLTTPNTPLDKSFAVQSAKLGNRNIYWTQKTEHSNQGHYFKFMEDLTHQDRLAIVEFLKTL